MLSDSRRAVLLAVGAGWLMFAASAAVAQCVGDCNGDGTVGINELILAVNIAIGSRDVADCPSIDRDDNGTVSINELILAVNNALDGCQPGEPTATNPPEPTATATPGPPVGPRIHTFGITTADDQLFGPWAVEGGIPVYRLPFGRSFRIIVEAGRGDSMVNPGRDTFRIGGAPSFQIQASRPLGNGSAQVCDGDLPPLPGGVPGIEPPSFEATSMIVDALNDLGCRFVDGTQEALGRGCNDQQACMRFEDGTFGCNSPSATEQFCSRVISAAEEFPVGDTLLSARVMECHQAATNCSGGVSVPLPGPVAQIIVRVLPPFPG